MYLVKHVPYMSITRHTSKKGKQDFFAFCGLYIKPSWIEEAFDYVNNLLQEEVSFYFITSSEFSPEFVARVRAYAIEQGWWIFEDVENPEREDINRRVLTKIKNGFLAITLRTLYNSDSFDSLTLRMIMNMHNEITYKYFGDCYLSDKMSIIGELGYGRLHYLLDEAEKRELLSFIEEFIRTKMETDSISTKAISDYERFESYMLSDDIFTFTP